MNRQQAYIIAGAANFRNQKIKDFQQAHDITAQLKRAVYESLPAARKIAKRFEATTPERTAFNVYSWIRQNFVYNREPASDQTAKTINRFLSEGFGDCKHFSTFSAAIFKALNMPVYFRVIDQTGRFNHIYTVLKYPGKEPIIIDGVFHYFNSEPIYTRKKDIKL
jgi:transglutaminase-like putative cysteine protease